MIYFVGEHETEGPVKIGFANGTGRPGNRAVASRVASLQTGNPRRLLLLAAFEGGQSIERRLHRTFRRSRLIGEWFSRTPELEGLIRSDGDHPLLGPIEIASTNSGPDDPVSSLSSGFVRALFSGV